MSNITIVTLADVSYYKVLFSMISSVNVFCGDINIHVVLVNADKSHEEKLKKCHDKINIEMENVKFSTEGEKRNYCTNRRAYLFKILRDVYEGHLVWVDADSIFRGDATDFKKHISDCEITMRPKDLKKGTFAAGVIGIGDTPICRDFINSYYDRVESEKDWMSNQRNLNETYRGYKGKINFKPLDKKYCDVWLSDKGVLWAAKSKQKKDKRYLSEIAKYE